MASWKEALARTRGRVASSLGRVFKRGGTIDAETLEELEETLLLADVPARQSMAWIKALEALPRESTPREALGALLSADLGEDHTVSWHRESKPYVILVVGVNGSGKTTTCAKLAHLAQRVNAAPLLCAGDTFRAAGSEQLRIWAERVGCEVVAGATGADAAAVAFDAMEAAEARKADVLIIDTAGRMHTRQPLMDELIKVHRAVTKKQADKPDEVWMVLDATLGQNALLQAREFHKTVPLTGVIVSKLDGSAKAGFLFGVTRELNVPVLFAGLGEGEDDLVPFVRAEFVDALLASDAPVETQG